MNRLERPPQHVRHVPDHGGLLRDIRPDDVDPLVCHGESSPLYVDAQTGAAWLCYLYFTIYSMCNQQSGRQFPAIWNQPGRDQVYRDDDKPPHFMFHNITIEAVLYCECEGAASAKRRAAVNSMCYAGIVGE